MHSKLNYKEDSKIHSDIVNSSITCSKCGKKVLIMYDRLICKRCGTLVFKKKEDEFKYRLSEKIIRNKKTKFI